MKNKSIVIKPVISEKSYALANAENKYTFVVGKQANKIEIKDEIEKKYKVVVENVNIVIKPGKMKVDMRTNRKGRRSDIRKAVVTLKKGDKIDEFLNT
ncbi:MAG: 50S ribosomal protein L23 [Candidatus Dojkabacteria bacterium]|jgi:large subunit ribosomal protein L23